MYLPKCPIINVSFAPYSPRRCTRHRTDNSQVEIFPAQPKVFVSRALEEPLVPFAAWNDSLHKQSPPTVISIIISTTAQLSGLRANLKKQKFEIELFNRMASSIFSRKRDLLYTLFFAIHIPVMFGTPNPTNYTKEPY